MGVSGHTTFSLLPHAGLELLGTLGFPWSLLLENPGKIPLGDLPGKILILGKMNFGPKWSNQNSGLGNGKIGLQRFQRLFRLGV